MIARAMRWGSGEPWTYIVRAFCSGTMIAEIPNAEPLEVGIARGGGGPQQIWVLMCVFAIQRRESMVCAAGSHLGH